MSYGGREIRQLIRDEESGGEKHFMVVREMGSFIWARPLGGCGLGRKGHQTLPTQERDSYRTSPFCMACKGVCQEFQSQMESAPRH